MKPISRKYEVKVTANHESDIQPNLAIESMPRVKTITGIDTDVVEVTLSEYASLADVKQIEQALENDPNVIEYSVVAGAYYTYDYGTGAWFDADNLAEALTVAAEWWEQGDWDRAEGPFVGEAWLVDPAEDEIHQIAFAAA